MSRTGRPGGYGLHDEASPVVPVCDGDQADRASAKHLIGKADTSYSRYDTRRREIRRERAAEMLTKSTTDNQVEGDSSMRDLEHHDAKLAA